MSTDRQLPIVSVIMSVHNGEKYLKEAVDSILAQTMSDFEFIVVNDGSTDKSLEILQSYRDYRIKIINLHHNVGLAQALNVAINDARGEYVARMDHDDISLPERLELQLRRFQENASLVLLGTYCHWVDSTGNQLYTHHMFAIDAELRSRLLLGNQFVHPSVMIRADALRKVGGYREIGGRYAQDYDLWLRLAEVGQIGNIEQPLLKYRIHSEQASTSKLESQRMAAETYLQLALQRYSGKPEDIDAAKRYVQKNRRRIRRQCAEELLHRRQSTKRSMSTWDSFLLYSDIIKFDPISHPLIATLTKFPRKLWRLVAGKR